MSPLFTASGSFVNVPAVSAMLTGVPLMAIEALMHHVGMRSVNGKQAPSAPLMVKFIVSVKG